MNPFQPLKQLVCEDCGEKFFGICGKFCPSCRRKRRQHKDMEVKVCKVCGLEKNMFADQIVCTDCMHALLHQNGNESRGVTAGLERRKARQTGGQLKKIKTCPNFDGANMGCVVCEPGSWEFKDCGGSK